MKKFFLYFIIFFVASFAFLNLRFISAEVKYDVFNNGNKKNVDSSTTQLTTDAKVDEPVKNKVDPSAGFSVEIPSLGITAPIIIENSSDSKVILNDLERGVVHYTDTPLPGESGTAVIIGHSSAYPWYRGNYGSIFALLGKLKIGDTIFIKNGNNVLEYHVSGSLVFYPLSKNSGIAELEKTDGSSIILSSCWPVGTNYKRLAIKADLIN